MQLIYFALLAALIAPRATFATPRPALAAPRSTFAPRPTIETIRRVAKRSPNGTSVVLTSIYRYGVDSLGRRGFLDSEGHPYTGTDTFVFRLAEALRQIEDGGPNGHALINYLDNAPHVTQIVPAPNDEADTDHGDFIHWNPDSDRGAPDERGGNYRPAFVGLAHELAHISDVWMGTINRSTWKVLPGEEDQLIEVPYAELYATRIENKIRAENGIPLRVSYASGIFNPEGARHFVDAASLLLRPGTRQSLYYNCHGYTTYHKLNKRELPETY